MRKLTLHKPALDDYVDVEKDLNENYRKIEEWANSSGTELDNKFDDGGVSTDYDTAKKMEDKIKFLATQIEKTPIGTILPFASGTIPKDYLLCDGREITKNDYSELYDILPFGGYIDEKVFRGLAKNEVPNMTGPTLNGYTITESSVFSATFPGWKAFDSVPSGDNGGWASLNGQKEGWVQIQYPNKRALSSFTIKTRTYAPGSKLEKISIYGVTTTSEEELFTENLSRAFTTNEKREFKVNFNKKTYDKFKIKVSAPNDQYCAIDEIELFTVDITQFPNHKQETTKKYLPDLRGQFLRGIKDRRKLLDWESEDIKKHNHKEPLAYPPESSATNTLKEYTEVREKKTIFQTLMLDDNVNDNVYGRPIAKETYEGNETRPSNIGVNYIIKAKNGINDNSIPAYIESLLNDLNNLKNNLGQHIKDNSIPSSKLKTDSDTDKIKLANLAEEVINSMSKLTKDSVVREYIADGAIDDEKIDGLGVTLRGITKSLENNIILEKGNGGAKILNGKAIEKVVINNETFALDVTYKSNPGFDGIIFDNNQGIFEIQTTYDIYIIIGSDTEKSKYYTFRPLGRGIEFGYFTNSYHTLSSTTINASLSNRVSKFRVSKDKIDILDTSNNDNVVFTITPESVPKIAEAFNNQVVGIMIWNSFVSANGKITLFSQYLENSNLTDKITNLEKSNEDLKNKIFVERKMYATNKDITLDNPLAITKGVQSISYDSVKGTTSATKISGSGYRHVFLGYKCDTMEMELVDIKYIVIGISNKNPDELFLYSPKNGNVIRYNNKTDTQTQAINIGALTGYENKRMTFSYKNGYLKISDEKNTYVNYNLSSKLDELLIKDFEVAFGKIDSPIKANFSIGEDISVIEKVNQNTESIKETNLKIIEESEKINTRIDSIITSDGGSDDSIDVVLFMGQSNMAGRGTASEAPIVPEGIAYEFRAVSDPTKLYPVTEPFGVNENREGGINEPGSKSGSMVSSLILNYYTYSGRKIVGISASKGGSSIKEWQSTGMYLKDVRQRLNGCLSYLEKQNIRVRDIFMFWCQGETDGDNSMTKEEYKQKFNSMWQFMKTELNVSKCFVVRIGYVNNSVVPNKYVTIIEAQREICEYSDELILVSTRFDSMKSEGLMRDSFHYKQFGYNLTGEDAGKNTAYYLKTGRKPSFYDWHYNDIYIPKYGTKKE